MLSDVTTEELRELIINYVTDYSWATIVLSCVACWFVYFLIEGFLRYFFYSHPVFFFGEKAVEKRIEKYKNEIARLEKSLKDDPRGGN